MVDLLSFDIMGAFYPGSSSPQIPLSTSQTGSFCHRTIELSGGSKSSTEHLEVP